jgi:hypothetical protein
MTFDVYPALPDIGPIVVPAGGSSAQIPIKELVDVASGFMFIRVLKLRVDDTAVVSPDPTIRLMADSGDPVDIPANTVGAIFNRPGGSGTEVADVRLLNTEGDVYGVRVKILHPGSSWRIQIVNRDPTSAHGFVWVVADSDAEAHQPWIDIAATLNFGAEPGQVVTKVLRIDNRGTAPLEIRDPDGDDLGAGFVLEAVRPNPIHPNSTADAQITFTGPDIPGTSATRYTVVSNDATARANTGHNQRVTLTATTQKPLWASGDILVVDPMATDGGAARRRGALIRVEPRTGAQTLVVYGSVFLAPVGLSIEADGNLVVVDARVRGVIRVDRLTGAATVLSAGGLLVQPVGLAVAADGGILVADSNAFPDRLGGVIRIDPVTFDQSRVAAGNMFVDPVGVALESNETILVCDSSAFGGPGDSKGGLIRVRLRDGLQSKVPSGDKFRKPVGLAMEKSGGVLVIDNDALGRSGAVFRIDPLTGAQSQVSSGNLLGSPVKAAVEADGNILVVDVKTTGHEKPLQPHLVRVSPTDGGQSELSVGTMFGNPLGIVVVPETV